jgi:8-oxo-dGTP pyrophosphatase MutT (NUDIX family)
MAELVERVDKDDHVLAVVERGEAIRHGWLHRVATSVCRDSDGRILVHRRPNDVSRFPGQYNWLIGGAVDVGETYEAAAAREIAEEIGVRTSARLVFTYLCRGAISPYWLGLHEATITQPITPDTSEIAWHTWLTEAELRDAIRSPTFVPDAQEAFTRYQALTDPPQLPRGE